MGPPCVVNAIHMSIFFLLLYLFVTSTSDQLCGEEGERAQVDHRISSLQKDLTRLSALIMEKKGHQENLEQDNILLETDFIRALKASIIITQTILCTAECRSDDIHCCCPG